MVAVLTVFVLVFLFIAFFIGYKKSTTFKGFFKFGFISLIVLTILEFTVFNFRTYESFFFNKEIKVTNYTIGEGLKQNPDGSFSFVSDEQNFIEINPIWEHLDNLYLKFKVNNTANEILIVHVGYTDAANQKYAYTQERRISGSRFNEGEYLRLHLSGKSKKIKIYFETLDSDDTFNIQNITFNKKVPLNICFIRPVLILCLLLLIYLFRPKSFIYEIGLFDKKAKKGIITAVILQMLFMGVVSQFNHYFVKDSFKTKQRYQYQMLAESFMKGHTYLDEEPSEILKNLKNPYDRKARAAAFKNTEESYIWDAAFYNNKYYVYFGVAPVITYYLPFYALTHHHIKTYTCIMITMLATVIGVFLLLYQLCKRNFKKTNLGVYLALSLLFVNACGFLSIMGRPDHYSLPILMGIMFSIYGLFWWIKAKDHNLKPLYLFLGSLCMAAVAACRPQLLLTSFFAIPIFLDEIKERKLLSKKSLKKTIAAALPYIVIAVLLMLYNYVRFGSPFDFGANYNLTTNDMTKRGIVFDRTFLGLYYYLFNPINIIPKFPFVIRDAVSTSYMGTTIYEDMGAGFIFVNLLVIFGLLIFKFKNEFKDKIIYKIGALSVIFSIIIIVADTQMAGILPRYICDFGFLLYLATSIVFLNKINQENKEKNSLLTKILYGCFIFGVIYNFILLFSDNILLKSELFFLLRRLFEFWI